MPTCSLIVISQLFNNAKLRLRPAIMERSRIHSLCLLSKNFESLCSAKAIVAFATCNASVADATRSIAAREEQRRSAHSNLMPQSFILRIAQPGNGFPGAQQASQGCGIRLSASVGLESLVGSYESIQETRRNCRQACSLLALNATPSFHLHE